MSISDQIICEEATSAKKKLSNYCYLLLPSCLRWQRDKKNLIDVKNSRLQTFFRNLIPTFRCESKFPASQYVEKKHYAEMKCSLEPFYSEYKQMCDTVQTRQITFLYV